MPLNKSIYHVRFKRYTKDPLQARENMGPQGHIIYKEMYAARIAPSPDVHFFVKIVNFAVPYFLKFATDSSETLPKFGMINRMRAVKLISCSYYRMQGHLLYIRHNLLKDKTIGTVMIQ